MPVVNPVKLLFVVNVDWFFFSHRLSIALAAIDSGYEVHLATTFTTFRAQIEQLGIFTHDLHLDRSGRSPLNFLRNFFILARIYNYLRPQVLHLVTIQPNIIGGILSRLFRIPSVVYAISGLGHVFIDKSFVGILRRRIVLLLYRISLDSSHRRVIFQNNHDLFLLTKLANLKSHEIVLIPGSGVDLKLYNYSPLPTTKPVILMASRLLRTKGVWEFVKAAQIIRDRGFDVIFQLAGDPDPSNPASISVDELDFISRDNSVTLLGQRSDLYNLLSLSSLFILPSYLEGLPKVLCEAASCGRPIITTDVPGCRDAINPGITGLLVPARDSLALANAIEILLTDESLMFSMSICSRSRAEKFYDLDLIIKQHLDVYSDILSARIR